jgi:hypothetical protein
VILHGGTHSEPFEDTPDPADQVVRDITTAFWDRYLKDEKAAAKRIRSAVSKYCDADLDWQVKPNAASATSCARPAPA